MAVTFYRTNRFGVRQDELDVIEAVHTESLHDDKLEPTIKPQTVEKGDRIFWRGSEESSETRAKEHVVNIITETRDSNGQPVIKLSCVGSMYFDLRYEFVELFHTFFSRGSGKRPSMWNTQSEFTSRMGSLMQYGYDRADENVVDDGRWRIINRDIDTPPRDSELGVFYIKNKLEVIEKIMSAVDGEFFPVIDWVGRGITQRTVYLVKQRGRQDAFWRFEYGDNVGTVERKKTGHNVVSRLYIFGEELRSKEEGTGLGNLGAIDRSIISDVGGINSVPGRRYKNALVPRTIGESEYFYPSTTLSSGETAIGRLDYLGYDIARKQDIARRSLGDVDKRAIVGTVYDNRPYIESSAALRDWGLTARYDSTQKLHTSDYIIVDGTNTDYKSKGNLYNEATTEWYKRRKIRTEYSALGASISENDDEWKAGVGDTVQIVDANRSPAIRAESRITETRRDLVNGKLDLTIDASSGSITRLFDSADKKTQKNSERITSVQSRQ